MYFFFTFTLVIINTHKHHRRTQAYRDRRDRIKNQTKYCIYTIYILHTYVLYEFKLIVNYVYEVYFCEYTKNGRARYSISVAHLINSIYRKYVHILYMGTKSCPLQNNKKNMTTRNHGNYISKTRTIHSKFS